MQSLVVHDDCYNAHGAPSWVAVDDLAFPMALTWALRIVFNRSRSQRREHVAGRKISLEHSVFGMTCPNYRVGAFGKLPDSALRTGCGHSQCSYPAWLAL
jgi:hypothetical protein